MARGLPAASLVIASIVAWTALDASPAAAQFNPLEALFGSPPRPPSSVPGARQQLPAPQPQYPAQQGPDDQYPQYPGQQYPRPGQPAVQSQPLAPVPGGAAAAVDPMRGGQPPLAGLPPGQRPPRGTPQPADMSPQPGDDVMAEPPSQKIANKGALFSGLDKITGRIISFDAAVGETVQFGALQVTPRVCYTRPPTETPNTDAFIEVDEVTLQGEIKRIFTGWMFASSPGLHAVEHPIYDVWLTDCKHPVIAATAPAEPVPAEQPTKPATQRRPAQSTQQGAPQPRPPVR